MSCPGTHAVVTEIPEGSWTTRSVFPLENKIMAWLSIFPVRDDYRMNGPARKAVLPTLLMGEEQ